MRVERAQSRMVGEAEIVVAAKPEYGSAVQLITSPDSGRDHRRSTSAASARGLCEPAGGSSIERCVGHGAAVSWHSAPMAASDARGEDQADVAGDGAVRRVVEGAWLSSDCEEASTAGRARFSEGEMRANGALSDAQIARLVKLVGLWRHYGRSMNLVGQHGALDSIERQLAESLLVVRLGHRLGFPWRPEGPDAPAHSAGRARWLDVGSGAGFPALVVAALLNVELHLVEPRAKRATFLELALRSVGGEGRVFEGRLEAFEAGPGRDLLHTFAVASARAVFSPAEWLRRGQPWVRAGGWVIVEAHAGSTEALGWGREVRVDAAPWSARAFEVPGSTRDDD